MNNHYPFPLIPLPYDYTALEPHIDGLTMDLHHDRHLKTYVDNLNAALAPYPQYHSWTLEQLLYYADELPKDLQTPVLHNGGGVYNHNFYFAGMSPTSAKAPVGALADSINATFGSFDKFKDAFKTAALSVFGSGYAWLVAEADKSLKIITTANQDTPLPQNVYPLVAIDVWEHAYYLMHYNLRADYIDDWFGVANWDAASALYGQIATS
ncbi:MAG: superoxide dismutase [Oscillospiraceae bacterium]|nr:superoxide dismutase [Oscillospiraceae bacterium]MCL2213562.1 superoxide dismutase [Oscillospiraceae bacterium]